MIVLAGATSFFVGTAFQAQMPEYAHQHGSEEADVWYSVLFGANAAGAVIGAVILESVAVLQGGARAAIVYAAIWGAVMAIFPLAHGYAAAVTLLVLAGIFNIAFTSIAQALVQILAPPNLRGRVVGLFNTSMLGLRAGSGVTVGVLGAGIGGQLQQAQRRAARQDVIELRVLQDPVRADEGHVHVGALAHIPGLVDEDTVVEAALERFHLHEDVGQVVGALGDGVEGRLDGVRRRHDPQALRVPGIGIGEAGEDHHEEARLSPGSRGEPETPGTRGSPVANRTLSPPAGARRPHDDVPHLVPRWNLELRGPSRPDESIEVSLEVVDLARLDRRRVEDAVPAVHHMVVEGDDHERGIGHDPPELAR